MSSKIKLIFFSKFKKKIYYTNHVNVERVLLTHENLQQTCWLLLLNAFKSSELELIQTMQSLNRDCSTLFDFLLSRSEKSDNKNKAYLSIIDNKLHSKALIIDHIQAQHCRWVLDLSTWISKLSEKHKEDLRSAYKLNYQMHEIVHFDQKSISWCKKLSFTDT